MVQKPLNITQFCFCILPIGVNSELWVLLIPERCSGFNGTGTSSQNLEVSVFSLLPV